MPTASPEPASFAVREVGWRQPLAWLARGATDLRRCPLPGLLHGLACALFGALIWGVAHDLFWVLAGAFSGFLLVAPVVATGLYAVSRGLEQGRTPLLADCWAIWRGADPRLVHFGVLLALAGTGWVLTSAALVTAYAGVPIERPLDFLRAIVLAERGFLFETWLVLGALLAAPVFASSVVAIPLLLDTRAGVLQAVLTSWRVVLASPGPLALWAALIMALTLLGMGLALAGLVLVVPWLAHASWHAYRDLVVTGAVR
jgi:uncharacterized membrane protein